ncbi:MAG TPA: magnesium/cobalt transporter CorA [Candidatus Aminicenantes bacterium]|nr:magnesium/cobalt transporter CorA [Candidatus Aminicenantes bacterium]HRY64231.1 magnesium/cobalt transporter CorA [Candidatus Aminicenantes bacterium]HRZ71144.1 magnesium/cobalt transporter CorA [Candidatus Aminicenantes bacterium]
MTREEIKRSEKAGLAPGTLMYVGDKESRPARITVIDYDAAGFLEKEAATVEECFPFKETSTVTWINVDGLRDAPVIEKLGARFDIHPLVLEDIVTTTQRPKAEDLGNAVFVVLRMIEGGLDGGGLTADQLSLIIGPNYVLSFQETPGDCFGAVRERIRGGKGRIRKLGPDYLAYAIIDAVVDNYFLVLEKLGERIDALEEVLVEAPRREALHEIHALKREMIGLRKSVWPLREVVSGLERMETPLVRKSTGVFLRDVYDHAIQVIDTVESFREMLSSMVETYLSSASNRMNEIMKVLTIISTIFIPITFLVGVYGMNFPNMPEMRWRWGYLFVWALIVGAVATMAAFFRRRKWF